MKAQEYYVKYRDTLHSPDRDVGLKATSDFLMELNREVKHLLDARKCRNAASFIGVLKEVNQKYNAVMNRFERDFGAAPLVRDGFLEFWKREVPGLDIALRGKTISL